MAERKPSSAVADALHEASEGVSIELTYIGHLADMLFEQADTPDGNRIEALALAIRRMAESVGQQLADGAAAARAGKASHG